MSIFCIKWQKPQSPAALGLCAEGVKARLFVLKVQHEASLHHEDQHSPGPDALQRAVPVPLQVRRNLMLEQNISSSRMDDGLGLDLWSFIDFRDNMVDLVGSYQFDDQVSEGGDVFARDPYILRFRCLNTGECH